MKRTILIKYDWWGGHPADKKLWTGVFEDTGQVYDYDTKSRLIQSAEKDGHNWKVLRQHKNGNNTIVCQKSF